jgi:superfamily II DNA or RNA helicase
VWYKQEQYRRVRKETKVATSKKTKKGSNYHFHFGLFQRVRNFCMENSIGINLEGKVSRITPTYGISVPGYDLRPDQVDLVDLSCRRQRGYIIAPTRTGKTVVMMGLISRFPTANIIVLCSKKSVVSQTRKKFTDSISEKIGFIGDGKYDVNRITVGTIQSAVRKLPKKHLDTFYDIVIVDEAHFVSKFDGLYARFFEGVAAPVRLGFTATEPTREVAQLALEAYIGPKIGEITMEEAIELGLIIKPKIRLLKTPKLQRVRDLRRYDEVYDEGIVNNRPRHRMILEEVRKYLDDGKSVLILVRKRRHGRMMQAIARVMGIEIDYIHGDVGMTARDKVQEAFNEKEVQCVIATAAWKEGIDIPTLDVVFNAAGGKDELPTLQATARCLTKTDEKYQAIIHDVFDPSHPYLVDHFGNRLTLYMEKGWLE